MYKLKVILQLLHFFIKSLWRFFKKLCKIINSSLSSSFSIVTNKYIEKKVSKILLKNKCIEFNFKTNFRLTSGKLSPVYCDCRKLISFTSDRNTIMNFAVKKIKSYSFLDSTSVIAGGESAGIPYASLIAQKLKLPLTYIRKERKKFGKKSQIEGIINSKDKVILVEDLMTDGGSKFNFIKAISEEGAKLNAIFVIFNYGINYDYLIVNGKKIKVIYLSTWKDVIQTMIENELYKKRISRTVIDFLESIGVKNLKFSL